MTEANLNKQIMSTSMQWLKLQSDLRDVPDKLKPFMINELDSIEATIGFARARLKILRDMPTIVDGKIQVNGERGD